MNDPKKLNSQFDFNNIDIDQIIQTLTQYQKHCFKVCCDYWGIGYRGDDI